jgi:hypothetical protein
VLAVSRDRSNPVAGESAHDFGAISAPPHISPQVTRETAMRVCTAQEHIAGHGSAASRNGYARSPIVRNSVGSTGGTRPC